MSGGASISSGFSNVVTGRRVIVLMRPRRFTVAFCDAILYLELQILVLELDA